ncbi:MAG: hypothetical protein ACP5XB_24605, partial [Isosphaeraceae bacterium]
MLNRAHLIRRALFLAMLSCVAFGAPRADELSKAPSGEARLTSGRVVHYTIHFDRNSLRDSLRIGDGLIALTSSGTLLRFELPDVRLVREHIDTVDVTCLDLGQDSTPLAGLADGRVCRIDPVTLDLKGIARLPAPPQWIGWGKASENRPAGLIVVTRPTRPMHRGSQLWSVAHLEVNDLANGKTCTLDSGGVNIRFELRTDDPDLHLGGHLSSSFALSKGGLLNKSCV